MCVVCFQDLHVLVLVCVAMESESMGIIVRFAFP